MKKVLLLLFLFSVGSLISLEGCKKNAYTDAIVKADGDANVDGCGWLLNIGGDIFYPVGLRSKDLYDGAQISIQYTISAVPFTCVNNKVYEVANITKFLN
jgi:hypothetical protein